MENQGRIFYGPFINQRKGILSAVYLSDHVINNWHHYRLFQNWTEIISKLTSAPASNSPAPSRIPAFFTATFVLPEEYKQPLDSFLQVTGWTKGVAFLNGHNIGRYWPLVGPQKTLYAPSVFFRPYPQTNTIVLFEQEKNPCSKDTKLCKVEFVSKHIINGAVPTPVATKKPPTFVQKET